LGIEWVRENWDGWELKGKGNRKDNKTEKVKDLITTVRICLKTEKNKNLVKEYERKEI
jgi:hypothetical protein